MPNRLYQTVVHQMRDTIDRTIGVVESSGTILACSDLGKVGKTTTDVPVEQIGQGEGFVHNGYSYRPFGSHPTAETAVFVEGTDDQAAKYAAILASSLIIIKQYYDEKYDRNNFIKNLILDNILPGDIYLKARELHFNTDVNRVCLLVRTVSKPDVATFDIIQNLFPDKNKDFVISINEREIAIIKETHQGIDLKNLEQLARSIVDTLSSEFYTHCIVGIGTQVSGIKDIGASFKEARPTSCHQWFYGMSALTTITGLANLNTSEATSMQGMFTYCSTLTSLDLTHFNTANVVTKTNMCTGLHNLNQYGITTITCKQSVKEFLLNGTGLNANVTWNIVQ